ncbi:MAG: hypothetical protein M1493_09535, partial [Firmicutes bacterium]|nr:hypothetical protein [Bacillota bacterium]
HNGNVFFIMSPSQSTLTNRQSFVQHRFSGSPAYADEGHEIRTHHKRRGSSSVFPLRPEID